MQMTMYNTKLFSEIYASAEEFVNDYNLIHLGGLKDETVNTLYYLLYAKYGNSPIANLDETQFKYKLFSVIFSFGPTWEKKLDIQSWLRDLSQDDLLKGSMAIHNHALNPGEMNSEVLTKDNPELTYIDAQNTSRFEKSKMDAYTQLWDLLSTDVTTTFINKFSICFKQFVRPENIYLYEE